MNSPIAKRSHPSRSQRGVALILVLVMLPLVAIIMVQLQFETTVGQHLAANVLANQQFKYAIHARIRQMRLRLTRDLQNDNEAAQQEGAFDHYSDDWGPDTEQGGTSVMVTSGDSEAGDDITLYTEIYDEQGKFNLNMLQHTDVRIQKRSFQVFRGLLDLFRDDRYGDVPDNEWDVEEGEAEELANAVVEFLKGDTRDERVRGAEMPAPNEGMKQGIYTTRDLVFVHRLFTKKRLLERFADPETGEMMPSLFDFVTVHGDGRINVNTAPIQVLRAMFTSEEGRAEVAKQIFNGRGGFLETDEDAESKDALAEEREELRQSGDEEALDQTIAMYTSVNELTQNVDGMRDQGFIRREEIDVARDFTVRSNFFRIQVSARRENFVRQQIVIVERNANGTKTWATEVRAITLRELPEAAGTDGPSLQ